jgi:hypothetical protein
MHMLYFKNFFEYYGLIYISYINYILVFRISTTLLYKQKFTQYPICET